MHALSVDLFDSSSRRGRLAGCDPAHGLPAHLVMPILLLGMYTCNNKFVVGVHHGRKLYSVSQHSKHQRPHNLTFTPPGPCPNPTPLDDENGLSALSLEGFIHLFRWQHRRRASTQPITRRRARPHHGRAPTRTFLPLLFSSEEAGPSSSSLPCAYIAHPRAVLTCFVPGFPLPLALSHGLMLN